MIPNRMHVIGASISLTGRQRHRLQKRWFKKPIRVLQVEEEYLYITVIGLTEATEKRRRWRDWRLEDEIFQHYEAQKL
jgi:hypothetical protein